MGYLAAVIYWLFSMDGGGTQLPLLMLVIGAFITGLGTFWTHLRVALMRALPNFPGKSRLPPWDDVTASSE